VMPWMTEDGIEFTLEECKLCSSKRLCGKCGHGHEAQSNFGKPYRVIRWVNGKKVTYEAPVISCLEFQKLTGLEDESGNHGGSRSTNARCANARAK